MIAFYYLTFKSIETEKALIDQEELYQLKKLLGDRIFLLRFRHYVTSFSHSIFFYKDIATMQLLSAT